MQAILDDKRINNFGDDDNFYRNYSCDLYCHHHEDDLDHHHHTSNVDPDENTNLDNIHKCSAHKNKHYHTIEHNYDTNNDPNVI
ncbi:hypothetical protein M427DRAFT_29531 [Gonapodya prolifera JEL478]|uniref:Uncharacterized protein n=1 Tax=Gonapodya prolifera (strain JEL478) TaxID=1344416 RepID=A0A139APE9_GONPJ|nr:hypothetical protein M427DRAFT_29531 [Gonapodya prolifera JEL478]|eukprot:KXS18616.1 hypothetical protein M427DRAFT_29531 [Gonapodya prolifera JEL478]